MSIEHEKVDKIMLVIERVLGRTPYIHQYNRLYEGVLDVITDVESHFNAIIDDYQKHNNALEEELSELRG